MDPSLPTLTGLAAIVLAIGLALRALRQPYVVAYLVVGVIVGPGMLGLVDEPRLLHQVGSIGVLFLLFFAGLEVSIQRLVARWRIAVLGTLAQIGASLGCSWLIGLWLDWSVARIVLLAFVISASSTTVVVRLLQQWRQLDGEVGQNVLAILLVQDLTLVPMMIVLGFLAGDRPTPDVVARQVVGGVVILAGVAAMARRGSIRLPLGSWIRTDHELQIFAALTLCFGLAWITGLLGLSSALGAFVAGIILSSARETEWVRGALRPFEVVLVGVFFVSVGMTVEPTFMLERWRAVLALVVSALVTNTTINVGILRLLGRSWPESLYAGAIMGQIGEFSFVLAAIGLQAGIIERPAHQLTVSVIFWTLLLSPIWIAPFRRFAGRTQPT